jgi:hypothetical protein
VAEVIAEFKNTDFNAESVVSVAAPVGRTELVTLTFDVPPPVDAVETVPCANLSVMLVEPEKPASVKNAIREYPAMFI